MTTIYNDNGFLNFSIGKVATIEDFNSCDRSQGSIFEALQPGEIIVLVEGNFKLDEDLDLIKN